MSAVIGPRVGVKRTLRNWLLSMRIQNGGATLVKCPNCKSENTFTWEHEGRFSRAKCACGFKVSYVAANESVVAAERQTTITNICDELRKPKMKCPWCRKIPDITLDRLYDSDCKCGRLSTWAESLQILKTKMHMLRDVELMRRAIEAVH